MFISIQVYCINNFVTDDGKNPKEAYSPWRALQIIDLKRGGLLFTEFFRIQIS